MNLINNKVKQAKAGNWGKPSKTEQAKSAHIVPADDEVVKHKSKKKKKKADRWHFWDCPFCKEEIPEKLVKPKGLHFVLWDREDHCKCGAYEVPACPACKNKTWFKDGVYTHNHNWGCGFTGKKK